jgi:hypothetical protein
VCGITATFVGPPIGASYYYNRSVRTGQTPTKTKDTAMALVFLAFIVLLVVASAVGLTTDSREGSDWTPTLDGTRVARWH